MEFFRISRELQFKIYILGELYASSHTGKKGEPFYKPFYTEEKEVGKAGVNRACGFSLAEPFPGKKEGFLLAVGLHPHCRA